MSLIILKEGDPERPIRTLEQLGLSKKVDNTICEREQIEHIERAEIYNNVFSSKECISLINKLNEEERWSCADGTSTSGEIVYRVSDRMMFLSDELCHEVLSRTNILNNIIPKLKTMKLRKRNFKPSNNNNNSGCASDGGNVESVVDSEYDMSITSNNNNNNNIKRPFNDYIINGEVGNEGNWEFIGINPCFRALRYRKGGHFKPHSDGSTVLGEGEDEMKSFVTLIIYLNDNFNGGSTKFFHEDMEAGGNEIKNEIARVIPSPGKCLFFYHDIIHSGEEVNSSFPTTSTSTSTSNNENEETLQKEDSFKYILRTELMYKRTCNDDEGGYSSEGIKLLRDAEKLESDGNFIESIKLYNKLRYKFPDIAEAAGI